MGQEIVHCAVCGLRLRSVDFDRGEALRVDHTAYCKACAPAGAVSSSRMPAADSTRRRKSGSTERIPIVTPRRHSEAVPASSPPALLIWGGAGLAFAVVAALVFLATKPREQRAEPPPVVVAPEPPRPAAIPEPARPRPAAASTEPEELAAIDAKLAAAVSRERFRDAFNLLAGSKSTHDTLEWTSAIQTRSNDLEKKVRDLHADLKEKAEQARKRGAEDEAKRLLERISGWDLPGYGTESAKGPDPQPPAPAPAPAPTSAPAPAPSPTPAPAADKPIAIPFNPGLPKWSLLTPSKMSATGDAVLTLLDDGSVLASGPNPFQVKYSLVVQTELKGITAFRLEVLPDRSLPAQGAGRAANGNIVLTEFKVQVIADPQAEAGTPVLFDKAAADFAQEGLPIGYAVDGKNDTGWGNWPFFGRAHEAAFEARTPIAGAGPFTLLIVLDHQSVHNEHTIGRFRLSASTAKNASQEIATRLPSTPVIDPKRVDQAIQKGIAWLRTAPYPEDHSWSANELMLWTFLHAGMPESDPDFQKRLKQMLDAPLDRTYRVALQAMILEELDRVAYQSRIWQCAQFLVDNQCANGQWLYGTPTDFSKGVPTAGKPVATAAKLDAEGHRIKPKVVRKLVVRKTREGPPDGDNSNSQYAALGLRACFDAGVLVPEDTILRAAKWWLETQYFDEKKEGEYAAKGWSYYGPAKESRAAHAMTVGGISSLTIYDYILGRDWKKSTALKAGVNWIAQSFVYSTTNLYYLYGMERAGVLYGTEKFGRYVWYPLGAAYILESQDSGGSWITHWGGKPDDLAWNAWDTCFAILYLKRATRPLVASEDSKR